MANTYVCLCGWSGNEMVNNTCPKCQRAAKDMYNKFDYLDQWAKKIAAWARRQGFKTGWPTFERKLLQGISELMEAHEEFRDTAYNTHCEAVQDKIREEIADCTIRLFDFLGATQRPDNETTAELFVRLMGENEQREFRHGKRF